MNLKMNKFINSKTFDILVYAIGGTVLLVSELKSLAIRNFKRYIKAYGKR